MACTTEQLLAVDRLLDGCQTNGGLDATAWVFNHADITAVTRDATSKVVETVTLAAGKTGYKWVGKSGSWSATATKAEDSTAWLQALNLVFNLGTALDRFKFEQLAAAAKLVFFIQDNNETIKIFGLGLTSGGEIAPLSGFERSAGNLDITAETGGDTTGRLTRSGEIANTYLDFLVDAGTLASSKAYLDGLLA